MGRPSAFDDESPFTLDELPRIHPFAEELAQTEQFAADEEDVGHIDQYDGELWGAEVDEAAATADLEQEDESGPALGVFTRWQRRIEVSACARRSTPARGARERARRSGVRRAASRAQSDRERRSQGRVA